MSLSLPPVCESASSRSIFDPRSAFLHVCLAKPGGKLELRRWERVLERGDCFEVHVVCPPPPHTLPRKVGEWGASAAGRAVLPVLVGIACVIKVTFGRWWHVADITWTSCDQGQA